MHDEIKGINHSEIGPGSKRSSKMFNNAPSVIDQQDGVTFDNRTLN
jgi:hypothetical protein